MEDITDLTADLDYECKVNREFHDSLRPKINTIDRNVSDIAQLRIDLENLKAKYQEDHKNLLGDFKKNALDFIYPVGSVYISLEEKNPQTFLGGNWTQITGRFLLACDSTHRVGTLGGEEFHKLTTEELPAHAHSATTDAKGKHTHTRGTMNITGYFGGIESYKGKNSAMKSWIGGAFYTGKGNVTTGNSPNDVMDCDETFFDASRAWTGATSECPNHTHTVTVSSTGSGQSHNNMPPYIAVYMYRRIS